MTHSARKAICELLAWDFAQLQKGEWNFVDSKGQFHPLGSKREQRAGQSMALKGVTSMKRAIVTVAITFFFRVRNDISLSILKYFKIKHT